MQIKSQNKQAFEEGRNYPKKLETAVARDTKNVRKNNDTINDNKTQQQHEHKNLHLFSLIWMVRGQYQENAFQSHQHELLIMENYFH